MGKYNVGINMGNRNSSHTLMLEQVRPNSMVLEMGCATGYMTRFLAEKLHCVVHVVEKDTAAIECAKPFAVDWYCGDLNEEGWKEYYEGNPKYDYILFGDVLEHLMDPLTTLTMATELLKDDGKVVISIPNICHNDIIIQMFNDHFRYTDLGLLDSTHIRFWGMADFVEFVNKAGLKVSDTEMVLFPTQATEQQLNSRVNDELMNLLRKRAYGEVYQWVFICEKR